MISSFVGPRFAHGYRLLLTVLALAYLTLEIAWSLRYGDAAFLGRDAFLWLYILALALEARFLSFPIGTITITLDTPVVVAAMFHIGPAATGLVVLLSMLIFGAWRAWRGEGPFAKAEGSPERIIRYLFTPSITAFLALLLARDDGGTAIWHMVTPWAFLDMAGQVLAVTAVFLVLQYTLVVIGYALEGGRLRRLMREAVAPGIGAEFALAPIAILFVWALDRTNPFPFVLLGIVYLAIADVLHRLASARARTLKTINELEWLIKTGEAPEPGIDGAITRRSEGFSSVVNTVGVASVDEVVGKVEANGGTVVMPKMAVPTVGWLAYCADPEGNMFGIMESDPNVS